MKATKPDKDKKDTRDGSRPLRPSRPSSPSPEASTGFIPPHGGYEELIAYQKPLVVFQATLYFCNRFIDKKSRTHDQMVQAARSGKQNILP